jgi:MoaA/NifB/PqqE/SkfB family radical SAM enzyme
VTFTGGEPTRRPDLVELVAYAQDIGQVSGLLTQGRRLAQSDYLSSLSAAGLDHILFSLAPDDDASMAGLRAALASDIFTAVHLLLPRTLADTRAIFEQLKAMGVPAVSLTVTEPGGAGRALLPEARELLANLGMDLVWDLPAPYSHLHPIKLEVETVREGGGRAWLYVEPDGDVLPTQGLGTVLGNALRDSWADLWARAAA